MKKQPTVRLGELLATKSGSVDPSKHLDEVFDLYSIPAFDRGEPEIIAGREIGSSKQIVEPRDVLLSKIVPHIRRAAIVGEHRNRRQIASGEWIVFRSEKLHPNYLRHVLVGDPFHSKFMSTVSGVGGSLLRARPAYVAQIEIPLPPLAEQRRIADILDRAEALRAKRRAALALLDTLTQSIFLDMFGDPVTNPKEWPITPLGQLIKSGPQNGFYKPASEYGTGTPIIRIDGFYAGVVTGLATLKRVNTNASERELYGLAVDDIIVNRVNSPEYLGKCAIIPELEEPTIFESNMMRLRVDPKLLNPRFTVEMLQSNRIASQIRRAAKDAVNQSSINQQDVRGFHFPLPPLTLQQAFARRVATVEALKATHRASLAKLDELFASLQDRAFRGEL